MTFEPDIIVKESDSNEISIVFEAKLFLEDKRSEDAAAGQLREYMSAMNIPVGVLVSPNRLIVFSDSYNGTGADSIEKVGEVSLGSQFSSYAFVPRLPPGVAMKRSFAFEKAFQSWIEEIAISRDLSEYHEELRSILSKYILPYIETGTVRAGFHRSKYAV